MFTLARNISLLHNTATPLVVWNSSNQGNAENYTDENVYGSISSILSISVHNITGGTGDRADGEVEVKGPLISKKVRDIIVIINMAILSQIISIFGVIANIINIVVYIKQGAGEAMTVTLIGLAVADLGTVTCQMWLSVCWNPWFNHETLKLPFRPLHIEYLSACHPRQSSVRISSWILAFATFERCLCITLPFKVRELITPYRARVFVVVVFIANTACTVPFYYTSRIVSFFDKGANRSYLVLSFTDDRQEIDSVFYGFAVSLTAIPFVAVALCTAVLVFHLNKASKWRESVTTNHLSEKNKAEDLQKQPPSLKETNNNREFFYKSEGTVKPLSKEKVQNAQLNKNKRAAKMVSMISTIFIVCNFPNTVNQLVMSIVPEYNKNGGYVNISQTFWSLGYFTETINASINIFMYYSMSTRYRNTIREMFCTRCFSDAEPGNTGRFVVDSDGKQGNTGDAGVCSAGKQGNTGDAGVCSAGKQGNTGDANVCSDRKARNTM
ncbi:chemosensory receptor A [Elysia marginata]|uniref:Chemosensory receptor A n=1 Tax=Elysia marginata TaxID=1093978 RepID=A0AAV4IKE5_9GAST|nr:chemosensory receptor A [Elysia marginata]